MLFLLGRESLFTPLFQLISKDLYIFVLLLVSELNLYFYSPTPNSLIKKNYYRTPEQGEKSGPLASCTPRKDVRKKGFRCRRRNKLTQPRHTFIIFGLIHFFFIAITPKHRAIDSSPVGPSIWLINCILGHGSIASCLGVAMA